MKRICLILMAVLLAFAMTGCSVLAFFIPEAEAPSSSARTFGGTPEMSDKLIGEMIISVPEDWRKEEIDDNTYFYPFEDNSAGMMYVFYSDFGVEIITDSTRREVYRSILTGMTNSGQNVDITSQDEVMIDGTLSQKFEFTQDINGSSYACEGYLVCHGSSVYGVIFASPGNLIQEFQDSKSAIIDSIRF